MFQPNLTSPVLGRDLRKRRKCVGQSHPSFSGLWWADGVGLRGHRESAREQKKTDNSSRLLPASIELEIWSTCVVKLHTRSSIRPGAVFRALRGVLVRCAVRRGREGEKRREVDKTSGHYTVVEEEWKRLQYKTGTEVVREGKKKIERERERYCCVGLLTFLILFFSAGGRYKGVNPPTRGGPAGCFGSKGGSGNTEYSSLAVKQRGTSAWVDSIRVSGCAVM